MTQDNLVSIDGEEEYTPFVCNICGQWWYSNPDAICTYTDNVDPEVKPISFNICIECSPGFHDLLELITRGVIGLADLTREAKTVQHKEESPT